MVGPNALDDNRARLAVRDNKVPQCRQLGPRVGWVGNRAEGDLHALRPQIDADIVGPTAGVAAREGRTVPLEEARRGFELAQA